MFISSTCILKSCTLCYDIAHNAYAKRKTYITDSNCFKRFICLFLYHTSLSCFPMQSFCDLYRDWFKYKLNYRSH